MTLPINVKLKVLRKGRKMSQQALADKMGISRAAISNYEIGRRTPHLNELKKFAEFFGVGLDFFGMAAQDEVFELLSRAKDIFENENISSEAKEELYKEIMRLYLSIDK